MIALLLLFVVATSILAVTLSKQVTIQALYPKKLTSLYLRGDNCGLSWDKGIKLNLASSFQTQPINGTVAGEGYVYSGVITCSSATSKVEVKVLVEDKTWMIGSNHHINIQASTTDNLVEQIYPWFYTSKGSLNIISKVYSKELTNFRDVIVYTPPSYLENTLKTHRNVLIMHDGQNLFDPKTSAFGTAWMCQNTVDSLVVQGAMDEVIIVGPYNTADRTNEYTYVYDPSEKAGGKGDLYLDWIESTLIPLVKENYRVDIQRERLGILGSSLGGLISCYAGWTRSSVYGKVGCMSSSFWWDSNDYQNNIIVNQRPDSKYPYPQFYMDSGTAGGDGSCAVYTTQIYEYYLSLGFKDNENVWKYIDNGGSHNEASWGARFYLPMKSLYSASTV